MQCYKAVLLIVAVALAGCGGSDATPTSPGSPSTPTPVPTTTVTITAAGVSPQVITVAVGSRVTFINNDSRSHEMNSDPHPTHGDCPPMDDVGFIAPGQTKLTGNFTVARTCGYHDHNMPDTRSLQGQIIVQ